MIGSIRRVAAVLVIALATMAATGCGSDASDRRATAGSETADNGADAGAGTPVDLPTGNSACTLLTQDEVARILGDGLQLGPGTSAGMCAWQSTDRSADLSDLQVQEATADEIASWVEEARSDGKDVTDLDVGDEAHRFDDAIGSVVVSRRGDVGVRLNLLSLGLPDSATMSTLTDLLATALERRSSP